jgi:hypothetical protein
MAGHPEMVSKQFYNAAETQYFNRLNIFRNIRKYLLQVRKMGSIFRERLNLTGQISGRASQNPGDARRVD